MPEGVGSPLVSVDHEALVVRKGARSGVYTVIAVHSTALGPALGGCRMTSYESTAQAVHGALRLSRGMTYKSAAAGLPLGGGKSVIAMEPGADREAALLDLADSVEFLDGMYISAEDVGTKPADMELIRTRTRHVVGLPRERAGGRSARSPPPASKPPCARASPSASARTAWTAAPSRWWGSGPSAGIRPVSERPGRRADHRRHQRGQARPGRLPHALERSQGAPCWLRWTCSPPVRSAACSMMRPSRPCAARSSAAPPPAAALPRGGPAEDLAARNIIYAPDFIANAGGIIHAAEEHAGEHDPERVAQRVQGIHDVVAQILEESESIGRTPLSAAYRSQGAAWWRAARRLG